MKKKVTHFTQEADENSLWDCTSPTWMAVILKADTAGVGTTLTEVGMSFGTAIMEIIMETPQKKSRNMELDRRFRGLLLAFAQRQSPTPINLMEAYNHR